MSQQNSNQSHQPISYPSPHSYPSPSMSAYAYPPPTQGQGTEPYRASPTGSNVSLPSLSLPPIRTIDGRPQSQQQQQQQQQQSQQQQGGQAVGSALPPPMAQFYHNQGQSLPPPQHPNVTSDPNQPLRYPLPPTDGRIMSGGRHKKEIKRRTKTGCLTCRKRRIKCDEAHPACRNCQKSKRDCLGYDPIFKSQPGPAAIQPAPSGAPSMQATSATSSPYPPPPQGYMPAGSQPYAPTLSTGLSSPGSSAEPYDYSAAIDPALEGAGTPQLQISANSYGGAQDFKQSLENASPYPLNASGQNHRAKRTKIDDLLAYEGVPPPVPPLSIAPIPYDEIRNIYSTVYAPGIDKFLETHWFRLRGLNHLLNDGRLCEQFSNLITRLTIDPQTANYFHTAVATKSLEASVVWSMMCLCRQVANTPNPTNGQVNDLELNDGVQDAASRLDIFERLVTGEYADNETLPTTEASNGTVLDDQLKRREREFWRLMNTFLTVRDDEASSAKEIDDTLSSCRSLLDSRENRDVIYSIAIVRHVGQRMAEFPDNLPHPVNNDEHDARNKLSVAKAFIENEAEGKGTNQVIQRLCGMAKRSWTVRR